MRRDRQEYRQNGFILIVVLGAVLMLSALLYGFNQATRTSLDKADGFCSAEQVWNSAWAGLQIAVAAIRDTEDLSADPKWARLLDGENAFPVGDASCSITVTEENGLLNINHLKNADGQLERKRVDQFLRLIDLVNGQQTDSQRIGYGIVPGIIDWVDRDDEVTHLPFIKRENTGAEYDYYETHTPAYRCRNKPLDTIDEILWIKGITPEAFSRLRPLLTCLGDGKVNINAAPLLIIESLSEQMDAALAQMIVSHRKLKPFGSTAELRNVPGMTDNAYVAMKDLITVAPTERYYRITSRGSTRNRKCTIEALLQRNTQAGNVDIVSYREL